MNQNPSTKTRLLIALWAAVLVLASVYLLVGQPVRGAREAWLEGDVDAAHATLSRWSKLRLRPADYDTLLAAVLLERGDPAAAARLERLSNHEPQLFPLVRKEDVARRLVSIGRYQEFLQFDSVAKERFEGSDLALYRAAAQLGIGRIDEADTTFRSIDADDVETEKYETLRLALDQRKQGSHPLVLDRDGNTIGIWSMRNRDLVAVNRDFAPLIESEGGRFTIESQLQSIGTSATLLTTLDPRFQKAAIDALGPYRASLVAIDLRTNRILAVANSGGGEPVRNLAFEAAYEPGSVAKVLTGIVANELNLTARQIPASCEGFVVIDGRQFFDWARHGRLVSLEEAMAVSCNVVFGNLGLEIGGEKLIAAFRAAGFDGTANLGLFDVPLGKTRGVPSSEFDLANLAVGLEQETMSALHIAMVAAAVANGGTLNTPRLLESRRSILGETLPSDPAPPAVRIGTPAAVRGIVPSLTAVVEDGRGTGRRAVVEGLPIAMKTGTAGDSAGGFDSVILAFAPADAPRIAIGMIAENAGPAEFAGARIAHDFFTGVEPLIREGTAPR